ncbi:hypothetical protein [Ectopseudomonas composti]|uniref:hypothetical protein n=1 Tax=Ectopseudomonas composti TaxID=658457 RepID=UPI000B190314|nr:hypothetical protein [Pseudomonas composti]
MSAALDLLQWRHDMAEPELPPQETKIGKQWLEESIHTLILGLNVEVGPVTILARDFISEFAQRSIELQAQDTEFHLEWAFARGNAVFAGTEYQKLAREVAERMLMPHINEAILRRKWLEEDHD